MGTTLALSGGNTANGTNIQAESMNYSTGAEMEGYPLTGQLLQPVKDGSHVLTSAADTEKL